MLEINYSYNIKSNIIKLSIISSISSSLLFPNAVISTDINNRIDSSSIIIDNNNNNNNNNNNKKSLTSNTITSNSNDNLIKRLSNKLIYSDSYKPGILSNDVYYPLFYNGLWKSSSRFTELYTPLGVDMFGGDKAYEIAKNDLGSILVYNSKFKRIDNNNNNNNNNIINDLIISDRLYNLKSIAKSSMGEKSIVDETQRSNDLANNMNLIISPLQSNGNFFDINLQVTDREYKNIDNKLYVLERTKQTIRNVMPETEFSNQRISQPSLQKEIETITSYSIIDDNTILAKQRTATYLCNLDPRYKKLIEIEPKISDTAIDIRYYEITYNRYNDKK